MENNNDEQPKKKGLSKGIIAIIIAVIVLAGGGAAAFFLTASTPKATYFQAEKNSIEQLQDFMETRYEDEYNWYEQSMENPVSQNVSLGLNLEGLETQGLIDPQMSAMISNAELAFNTETDMENKQTYGEVSLNVAGMNLDGITGYVEGSDLYTELPFLEEVLMISDEDIGSVLAEMDPYMFTGNEQLGIEELMFENDGSLLTEEEKEYIQDEYLMFIYDELPDDSFESENEDVEVNGDSISAEKITMNLSEEEFKSVITSVLEKMKGDEKFQEILQNQFERTAAAPLEDPEVIQQQIDEVLAEFDSSIDQGIEAVESFQFPDGIQSTLWVSDDKVVQRDFSISLAPEGEEPVPFSLSGGQLFNDDQIYFDHTITMGNEDMEISIGLDGDFQGTGDTVTDNANLNFVLDDGYMPFEITGTYTGDESLDGSTRNFDRQLQFTVDNDTINLGWTGDSTYDGDQMSSNNNIALDFPGYIDNVSMDINSEGAVIDAVEGVDTSNVVDLGSMSAEELQQYFEGDFNSQLEQWLMQFGL
ncbi:DUF6583 family protein [Oceanobacillus jeddahense]|uniref:DUF945 domain-containing protein n=1 Tax=Oceanobacillus jeddahense TaxID=1462527 RepID=A0ABY5JY08_9BACI|nr:DUF6583 family protein [Oceanobacillus jeddahense]UUI05278.1 hypothetical protein NP439_11805 [Oceanobacillus jeddahense]